jgi:hypothetical protein
MGATAAASVQFWSVSCSPVLGDYPLITARARSSRPPPWIGAPINISADKGPILVASRWPPRPRERRDPLWIIMWLGLS